jgi:hypothetical protein
LRRLGVSKQRVYEIREKPEFPLPVARLASGPVWARSMLTRFISEWPRKRTGRPRKTADLADALNESVQAVKADQKRQSEGRAAMRATGRKAAAKTGSKTMRKRVAS